MRVAPEVATALAEHRPVVALETSIVAHGLPHPQNLEAGHGCEEAIRNEGGVPAPVAVVRGELRIGLRAGELEALAAGGARKVSARDLGAALARGEDGATTVAATVRAAALAGIRIMATGGIGGVHRGHPEDESADLAELARSQVAVFCAGAKSILDLGRTRERLESLSVPLLGLGCDEMPAFYSKLSGYPVDARADSPEEMARILLASWQTGSRGVVVGVPPPEELPEAALMIEQAVKEAGPVRGPEATPWVLRRLAALSGGRSVEVNVKLAVNNARQAARTAAAMARLEDPDGGPATPPRSA
ncbi:MAG: pseudouridine-5'-phosphate glycosidase [Candidatus Dormibacterales bacterium]